MLSREVMRHIGPTQQQRWEAWTRAEMVGSNFGLRMAAEQPGRNQGRLHRRGDMQKDEQEFTQRSGMEGKAFRQREQCTRRNRGQRVAADRRMWPNFLNDDSTSYGPIRLILSYLLRVV